MLFERSCGPFRAIRARPLRSCVHTTCSMQQHTTQLALDCADPATANAGPVPVEYSARMILGGTSTMARRGTAGARPPLWTTVASVTAPEGTAGLLGLLPRRRATVLRAHNRTHSTLSFALYYTLRTQRRAPNRCRLARCPRPSPSQARTSFQAPRAAARPCHWRCGRLRKNTTRSYSQKRVP